jgi:chitinase
MPGSRCWGRLLMSTAVVLAVTGCDPRPQGGRARETEVTQTSPAPRAQWFGGYLDVTLFPRLRLQDPPPRGKVTTVLSFISADPAKPCEPSWDGYYNLEQASTELGLDAQVASHREAGNEIAVSFGGQLGTELAVACIDSDALVRAYAAVITKYGLNTVDLDIEGRGLQDHAAAERRAAAIARLQDERPAGDPLDVWLTLPVSADGLTPDGEKAVGTMLAAGVELAGVNIMTMNFGPLAPGQTMLAAAIGAAEGTHRALTIMYGESGHAMDAAALWNKIGLTPMIGINDVKGQVFTPEDAEGLNRFARERGIGRMSMWSLNRDAACTPENEGELRNGVSNHCSGVAQDPGMFAQLLGNAYTR